MEFVNLVAHGVAIIGNIGYGYELEHLVKGSFGTPAPLVLPRPGPAGPAVPGRNIVRLLVSDKRGRG